jgi:hypothetical protein
MTCWLISVLAALLYGLGFGATFAIQAQLPARLGLVLMRSALWPLWIVTGGRPRGTPGILD